MKYCQNCGHPMDDPASVCPGCGAAMPCVSGFRAIQSTDSGSVLWAFLGGFFPLIGLIVFLCMYFDRHKTAKMAGIGAVVGTCIRLLIAILFVGYCCFMMR